MVILAGCGGAADSGGGGSSSSGGPSSGGNSSTSQAGSTAAMLTYKDVLYIMDPYRLKIFDISSPEQTVLVNTVRLSGAETLFIYEGYLYIGGNSGVDILNIEDPHYPMKVSKYNHVRACDPVIVSSGIGYVTLRNRPGCGGDVNRLEVVDFTDPLNPQLIDTFPMDNPYGLAKTETYLAVCQEDKGLSFLSVAVNEPNGVKEAKIGEVARFFDIHCFDAIASDKSLITTATDGIYQFKMDGYILTALSKIPVGEEMETAKDEMMN